MNIKAAKLCPAQWHHYGRGPSEGIQLVDLAGLANLRKCQTAEIVSHKLQKLFSVHGSIVGWSERSESAINLCVVVLS
jgi:hypothetical protein